MKFLDKNQDETKEIMNFRVGALAEWVKLLLEMPHARTQCRFESQLFHFQFVFLHSRIHKMMGSSTLT